MARRARSEQLALFFIQFRKYPRTLALNYHVENAFGYFVSPVFIVHVIH